MTNQELKSSLIGSNLIPFVYATFESHKQHKIPPTMKICSSEKSHLFFICLSYNIIFFRCSRVLCTTLEHFLNFLEIIVRIIYVVTLELFYKIGALAQTLFLAST